jgi:hypothetical protein
VTRSRPDVIVSGGLVAGQRIPVHVGRNQLDGLVQTVGYTVKDSVEPTDTRKVAPPMIGPLRPRRGQIGPVHGPALSWEWRPREDSNLRPPV